MDEATKNRAWAHALVDAAFTYTTSCGGQLPT